MRKLLTIVLLSALFMSGCVLTSFNPLYKKSDLVSNDEIVGKWIGKNSILTFVKLAESGYLVNYKDCEDPYNAPEDFSSCTVADFTVQLLKLGNDYYFDFFPRSYLNTDNLFLKFHVKPVHSFAKVVIKKDALEVYLFTYSWMVNYVDKNKGKLDHIKSDDFITLTASTEALQEFVLKHQAEPGFFDDPIILKRQ